VHLNAQCASASAGTCSGTATLGEEVWAFIPKNVLPYLKYTADSGYGGCHLYSVDLSPIFSTPASATQMTAMCLTYQERPVIGERS
jgi:hypothetical protein